MAIREPKSNRPAPLLGEAELDIGEADIDDSLLGLELDLSLAQQQRILDLSTRLRAVDFYTLLGLQPAADTQAIKRAYNEYVSELHPDRFFRKRLGTFRRKLDSIFIRMSEARDVLCSPEERARYDELLRSERASDLDALVEEAVAELEAEKGEKRVEEVVVDRSIRVSTERPPDVQRTSHGSGFQAAARALSSEETAQLQELHHRRKRLGRLEPTDAERYGLLCERFARAFMAEQQVGLREGQMYRQALRVPHACRLTLSTGGRSHSTITLDLSERGLATLVRTMLPKGALCELVLHTSPEPIRARSQVVACVKHGSGTASFRVSLELEPLDVKAAERLEIIVLDAALRRGAPEDALG